MALNVLQDLFGGSNTQQQSQSTSTPINMQAPAYTALQPQVASSLSNMLASGGPAPYTGALTPDITANQTQTLGQLQGMTGPQNQDSQYLSGVMQGNYLPGQANSNPFLGDAITAAQRTTMNNLNQTLSRSLPGQFLQAGQQLGSNGSSAFDRAAAIQSQTAANTMGDIAANMSNTNFQSERQNQQQAVALNQQEVQNSVANLTAQALPEMIQSQGIDRALALHQQQSSNILQLLQTLAGYTAPVVANQSQSTGSSTTNSTGGVIPGLANGANGLKALGLTA